MGRIAIWLALAAAIGVAAWFVMGDTGLLDGGPLGSSGEPDAYESLHNPELYGSTGPRRKKEGDEDASNKDENAKEDNEGPKQQRLVGIVVDESRRPVAGAIVVAALRDLKHVEATTDADGKFALPIDAPEQTSNPWWMRGSLFARTSDGRVGSSNFQPSFDGTKADVPLGKIVVRKGWPVRCRVVRGGTAVPNASYWVTSRRGGTILQHGSADASGAIETKVFPKGNYTVVACTPKAADAKSYTGTLSMGRGAARVKVPIAASAELPEVELKDTRTITVRVLDKESQTPIANAEVQVGDNWSRPAPAGIGYLPPLPAMRTGENGESVKVSGVPVDGHISVTASAEGYPQSNGYGGMGQARGNADTSEITVHLSGYREVAFPIGPSDVTPPTNGEAVTVKRTSWYGAQSKDEEKLSGKVEGGSVIISGLRPQWDSGHVSTADGRVAAYNAPQGDAAAPALKFIRAKPLTLRLLDESGNVKIGAKLSLADSNGRNYQAPQTTDEKGEATFENLTWNNVLVRHVEPGSNQWWQAPVVDKFSRTDVEGVREIRLKSGARLRLRVLLDGVAKLPAKYSLQVGRRRLKSADIEENPDAATLECTTLPTDWVKNGDTKIVLYAEGCMPDTLTLSESAATDGSEHTLNIMTSGEFIVRVTPPSDGSHSLSIQLWDDDSQKWKGTHPKGWARPRDPEEEKDKNSRRFGGLDQGRYRVIDQLSRATSGAIDVVPGQSGGSGGVQEVALDLSSVVFVRGRVIVPEGTLANSVRVKRVGATGPNVYYPSGMNVEMVSSMNSSSSWRGGGGNIQIKPDGSFSVRALQGEKVVLEFSHQYLSVVGGKYRVTTKGGESGLLVEFEAAGVISFQLPALKKASSSSSAMSPYRRGGSWVSVSLLRTDVEGVAAQPRNIQPKDDVYRIGGVPHGTYDMHINVNGYARYTHSGIKYGAKGADLGAISLSKGASIHVQIIPASEGDSIPYANIVATYLEPGNTHTRHASHTKEKGKLLLSGLAAGRWKVVGYVHNMINSGGPSKPIIDREVKVSGTELVNIEHRLPKLGE